MSKKHRSRRSQGSSENLPAVIETVKALRELELAMKADRVIEDPEAVTTKDTFSATMNPVARRQSTDEDDPFEQSLYADDVLLQPHWNPWMLYRIFEESDILQACLRVYVDNLARPYDLEYCGPKEENGKHEDERRSISDFLSQVNEKHSWLTVSRKKELDFWVTGNAYIEVPPDKKTLEPYMLYNCPPSFMRVTPLDKEETLTIVKLPRNGEIKEMPVYRKFRRFVRWLPTKDMVWFKELGDPRAVNKFTGKYIKDARGNYILERDMKPGDYKDERANAIWWFRDLYGGNQYGVSRWVAAMADIRGLYLSAWVNFDCLDHGGMPPWLLLVYGKLSEGTRKYLKQVIRKWRDPNAFSDPGILEIEPNLLSWNSSGGSKAGAEFVSMRDMRNEDAMFVNYARNARSNIGSTLRIPGIFYGAPDAVGGANLAAIDVTESQLFEPIRRANDERVNVELLQAQFGIYNWRLKTKRPPLNGDSWYKALGMQGRTGGPSLNDLTVAGNEIFGTNWPVREHWFYSKISSAEAIGMVRAGQVSYDNETGDPIVHPPATVAQQPDFLATIDEKQASDSSMPAATEVLSILQAFQRLENQAKAYRAPTDPNPDFRM
jgi:capsid portal protein